MMDNVTYALHLAKLGFWLFPAAIGAKCPIKGMRFKEMASRDPVQLTAWFADGRNRIGIYTGRFGENEALLVVDSDKKPAEGDKPAKNGDAELFDLAVDGFTLPPTREHRSDSGGRHLFFRVDAPVRQGTNVLAHGLDIRSNGGFVVAYPGNDVALASAPPWLIDKCGMPRQREGSHADIPAPSDAIKERCRDYLLNEAPLAIQGEGGDQTTYNVACRLRDKGCDEMAALELMLEHWNERCTPAWDFYGLEKKVSNAFEYATEPPGKDVPGGIL